MSEATAGDRLRVISWNLHAPPFAPRIDERVEADAEWVLSQGDAPGAPDFLLFQELWYPSVAADLANLLAPVYEVLRLPRGRVPGDLGGMLSLVRRGNGWSVRSTRFQPFTRSAPAWRIWEGDGLAEKGMDRIECRSTHGDLVLFNTHLQARYGERTYTPIRESQLAELLASAASVAPGAAVVVCGDLNTLPDEPFFVDQTAAWIDLTEAYRRRCGCGTRVSESQPGHWIDYLLTRRDPGPRVSTLRIERIESRSPDVPFSDHHGLDATLAIARPSRAALPVAVLALLALSGDSTRREWLSSAATLAFCGLLPSWAIGREPAPLP